MTSELIDFFVRQYNNDYRVIKSALATLNESHLWADTPDGVSVANYVCHTCEMERFWIDWGLLQTPFDRDREKEFTRSKDATREEILAMIDERMALTLKAIDTLSPQNWTDTREFHGDTFTGQGIILWHSNHLALHRGHIQAHCRWLKREP